MDEANAWLRRLANLNVYRAKGGPAPHKALLLLNLLDSFKELAPDGRTLTLSPALAYRFGVFWTIVAHRRTQPPSVRLPFFHLSSDGLWECFDEDGAPCDDRRKAATAVLDPAFVAFLQDTGNRLAAMRVLVETFFPVEERAELYALLQIAGPAKGDAELPVPESPPARGNAARFRLTVLSSYDYTCALTGYRLDAVDVGSPVDAAHIHAHAASRNNAPQNGIALSKLPHWLFDNGLWSLTDDLMVLVAGDRFFREAAPDQRALADYAGRAVRLPNVAANRPDPRCLRWHRRKVFLG
ncbi:HNH endonuclease [Alienimonas sp. DA493]|uniref:HNH endonuclease n=1 Tax=Alienimonas sp. DA493 TaxID=3373605 RepID=UPI0037548F01